MSTIPEAELPSDIAVFDAVEAAYPRELTGAQGAIRRGLPVLIECDKELVAFFYRALRERLRRDNRECIYLDGRVPPDAGPMAPQGVIPNLLIGLRNAVRGAVTDRIMVLPHLDLLTTSSTGITSEAREVISLLYENPQIMWIGFKDPTFPLPQVIRNLFPHSESILGVERERLRHLVTQRESRKFGRGLNPYQLYKYVSGVNAVRLRRLLASIEGEDYPADPEPALALLRASTLGGELSLPDLDLHKDIGGYKKVKERLTDEILTILAKKDAVSDDAERVAALESLIPRGMIFWGPPGTGKTLFAKAMASRLGAAVSVVSGPELKSRWVGESEERIRQVFVRARQSAPAVIIFDELDSFATARGTYTGSGVEHSMVNQLLTEMDGFRSDELVFVVGTTNFVESLDPALLRPGRFEFQLEIPYPGNDDRRAIFEIYNKKLSLQMNERALDYAVRRTMDHVNGGGHYTGDHIQALCRAIARRRIRDNLSGATEVEHVEDAIVRYLDKPELTSAEERVVATHEAGHAVCALNCEHAPPIRRISIGGDLGGALGAVQYDDPAHRYVITEAELLDRICMLFGGREAEILFCEDLSIGSSHDLHMATEIARGLVCDYGLGGDHVGIQRIGERGKEHELSEVTKAGIDSAIRHILDVQRRRAHALLSDKRLQVTALRDLLLEKKVLDAQSLGAFGGTGTLGGNGESEKDSDESRDE